MLAEEQELELYKLEDEQRQLEEQVAFCELERETVKTDVARFQRRYYDIVGRLYVELDELQAGIFLQEAVAHPDDRAAQIQARAAQERARLSAEEAGLIEAQPAPPSEISPECKKYYRKAAMLMHPDRATSDAERERRTQMMAQVNVAYERGDQAALEKLIFEFGEDPEAISGVDIVSRTLKSTRRIAQLKRRMNEIEQELDSLRDTEIFQLMTTVVEAEAMGENPLAEMAAKLIKDIFNRRVLAGR
jgi:hypothetical protein